MRNCVAIGLICVLAACSNEPVTEVPPDETPVTEIQETVSDTSLTEPESGGPLDVLEPAARTRLDSTCFAIVNAFINEDANELNKFIHPEYGAYLTYKMGVYPTFMYLHDVKEGEAFLPIKHSEQPAYPETLSVGEFNYNCGDGWDTTGFWMNARDNDGPVTTIAKDLITYELIDRLAPEDEKNISRLDNHNVAVAYTEFGEGLVFYVSWIDDAWYLSIIDNVTTNCGA